MYNLKSDNRTHCIRCGTCCIKGGPTLHKEDKKILLEGHISYQHLVTIRKGEPAFTPLSDKPEPVKQELIKVSGKGRAWECLFYDKKKSSCTIYKHRPLECRLLKCWDTSEILSAIGKDTITRADIISQDDPITKFIARHEKKCSVLMAENLISAVMKKNSDSISLAKLTALVQQDLVIRSKAISEFGLSVETELFYFGRPLFKILRSQGISVG
ncbi:MAG: YkgJ family cysteine cluster protein [Thermodesulfovibrionales bacterium]|nr:YkgJ family cysteine cluster protein [Thermodesulfovibrionales bacterium]MDP3112088.1 YkgJ family cysteine cluster protein [Thermodesulfovibrionales bacterium]